ncbi:MAG: nucleotide disphospho-sugar-binding domain-containing protein [Cyanobacteria bacterium J06639_1]
MARISFLTSAYTSILNANSELARRLQAAGHDIVYASPYPIERAIADRGLAFQQLSTPIAARGYAYGQLEQPADITASSKGSGRLGRVPRKLVGWLAKFTTVRQRRQAAIQSLGLAQIRDELAALSADLLLIDIELAEHVIAARSLGIPVALTSTWISVWKRPGLPPLHDTTLPESSHRGHQLQLEWRWWTFRWQQWSQRQRQRLRAVGCDRVSILETYAKAVGVSFWTDIDLYQWLLPFSYRTLPILSLNAFEFDFPHDPPPQAYYLGPMVGLDREATLTESDRATRQSLERIIANHRTNPESQALLYCAFGTFSGSYDSALLKRIIEAIARNPQWTLILSLGGRGDPQRLGQLPANAHAFDRVPQLFVLEQVDAAIVHAGIATISECIHFGVPMLAYSVEVTDQNGNAARVAGGGFGIRGDRDGDDAATIQRHLQTLLASPSIRENLHHMQAHFRRYTSENTAVKTVESLLPNR